MGDNDVMLGAARVRDPTIKQLMATAQNAAVFQSINNDWVSIRLGLESCLPILKSRSKRLMVITIQLTNV